MMNEKLASALTVAWLVTATGCGGGGGEDVGEPTASPAPAVDLPDAGTSVAGSDPDTASPFGTDPSAPPDPAGVPDDATPGGDAPDGAASAADDGPELQRPVGEGDDTAAIAGFWDYTRVTDTGADVALVAIAADGQVTEYDYQADPVGTGADCYSVSTSAIAARGDERYDIGNSSTLPGSDGAEDVLITLEGGEIVFRYLGDAFDPEFGEGQAGITERYPAVTDRTPEQLVLCEG